MTTRRSFDFSLLAIAALLVVQMSIASYGMGLFRDVAHTTRDQLAAVAHAGR